MICKRLGYEKVGEKSWCLEGTRMQTGVRSCDQKKQSMKTFFFFFNFLFRFREILYKKEIKVLKPFPSLALISIALPDSFIFLYAWKMKGGVNKKILSLFFGFIGSNTFWNHPKQFLIKILNLKVYCFFWGGGGFMGCGLSLWKSLLSRRNRNVSSQDQTSSTSERFPFFFFFMFTT